MQGRVSPIARKHSMRKYAMQNHPHPTTKPTLSACFSFYLRPISVLLLDRVGRSGRGNIVVSYRQVIIVVTCAFYSSPRSVR